MHQGVWRGFWPCLGREQSENGSLIVSAVHFHARRIRKKEMRREGDRAEDHDRSLLAMNTDAFIWSLSGLLLAGLLVSF